MNGSEPRTRSYTARLVQLVPHAFLPAPHAYCYTLIIYIHFTASLYGQHFCLGNSLLKIAFLHIFIITEIKRKINKSVLESMCADHLHSKNPRSCFFPHHFLEILNRCELCRQTCNPSYLGGRSNRVGISKLAWETS